MTFKSTLALHVLSFRPLLRLYLLKASVLRGVQYKCVSGSKNHPLAMAANGAAHGGGAVGGGGGGGGNIKVVVRVRPFNNRGRSQLSDRVHCLSNSDRTGQIGKMYSANERQANYTGASSSDRPTIKSEQSSLGWKQDVCI